MPGQALSRDTLQALDGDEGFELVADRKYIEAPSDKEAARFKWFMDNYEQISNEWEAANPPPPQGVDRKAYWAKSDKFLHDQMRAAGHRPPTADEQLSWAESMGPPLPYKNSQEFSPTPHKGKTPAEVGSEMMGANEWLNPDVIGNFLSNAMGHKIDPRKLAWCTYFVSSILKEGGQAYNKSSPGIARAYLKFGTDAKDNPQPGDLWVTKEHVALILGPGSKPGSVKTLEGNHFDGVYEGERTIDNQTAIRRPPSLGGRR